MALKENDYRMMASNIPTGSKTMQWDKAKWFADRPYRLGTYVQTTDTAVVEILAAAGFDFIVIDGEHGPVSIETVKHLILAAKAAGIVSFVRVRRCETDLIMSPLDAGANGVQIPQISDGEAARKAMASAKYDPDGFRGSNPYVRSNRYGADDYIAYVRDANLNTIVIVQVEGIEGIANLDDILAVSGIDVVWVGPYDLSQSMGIPGQVSHPSVLSKMKSVLEKADAHGIVGGTFADGIDSARRWIDLGVKLVAVSYETKMLFDKASEIVAGAGNSAPANS